MRRPADLGNLERGLHRSHLPFVPRGLHVKAHLTFVWYPFTVSDGEVLPAPTARGLPHQVPRRVLGVEDMVAAVAVQRDLNVPVLPALRKHDLVAVINIYRQHFMSFVVLTKFATVEMWARMFGICRGLVDARAG